jgi:hypothetical protein
MVVSVSPSCVCLEQNVPMQAPPLLSEADLIQMMNRHGIGTDATIAAHITTVQTREYAGMCISMYVRIYACVCVCMHGLYVCIYVCMYVCMYLCIRASAHTYIHCECVSDSVSLSVSFFLSLAHAHLHPLSFARVFSLSFSHFVPRHYSNPPFRLSFSRLLPLSLPRSLSLCLVLSLSFSEKCSNAAILADAAGQVVSDRL